MKMQISFLLFGFILISCSQNKERVILEQLTSLNRVEFNTEVSNFISDFIRSVPKEDFILELYIDKKTEDIYYLTIFDTPPRSNFTAEHFPLNYSLVDNRYVFVYTGLEDFINIKSYHSEVQLSENDLEGRYFMSTNTLLIIRDSLYVAGEFGLPFTDLIIVPPK